MVARLRGIGSTETGSVRTPRINWEDLGDIDVPAPPLAEQRAIARLLDAETARIDAVIIKKQQLVRLLEERWRVTAEMMMNHLGMDYGWAPLKRFVKCLDGRRVPLSGEERSLRRGVFPYYGASGVIDHVDDYLFDETVVLLGEDGAQLADPDYEIAFVVSGRIWVNNHAHVLRPVDSDPHFLALHLSTLDRSGFISGSTREKITQDDMGRIPIPNCPVETQQQAALLLREVRARCDFTVERLRRQVQLLAEHRQALITATVAGDRTVAR
jgi:type I restriction enzyme S subunit